MAKIETIKCDVCGTLKQKTNHWFRVPVMTRIFVVYSAGIICSHDNIQDACSDKCVLTLTQRWLDKEKENVKTSNA